MRTTVKLFHWLPRIICILAILLVSVFALDAFSSERTFLQNTAAFLMHLMPSFVLLTILIIAWKWELIGGIILAVIGLVMSPFVFTLNYNRNHFSLGQSIGIILMITFPFIVVGILFIISNYMKKKVKSEVLGETTKE